MEPRNNTPLPPRFASGPARSLTVSRALAQDEVEGGGPAPLTAQQRKDVERLRERALSHNGSTLGHASLPPQLPSVQELIEQLHENVATARSNRNVPSTPLPQTPLSEAQQAGFDWRMVADRAIAALESGSRRPLPLANDPAAADIPGMDHIVKMVNSRHQSTKASNLAALSAPAPSAADLADAQANLSAAGEWTEAESADLPAEALESGAPGEYLPADYADPAPLQPQDLSAAAAPAVADGFGEEEIILDAEEDDELVGDTEDEELLPEEFGAQLGELDLSDDPYVTDADMELAPAEQAYFEAPAEEHIAEQNYAEAAYAEGAYAEGTYAEPTAPQEAENFAEDAFAENTFAEAALGEDAFAEEEIILDAEEDDELVGDTEDEELLPEEFGADLGELDLADDSFVTNADTADQALAQPAYPADEAYLAAGEENATAPAYEVPAAAAEAAVVDSFGVAEIILDAEEDDELVGDTEDEELLPAEFGAELGELDLAEDPFITDADESYGSEAEEELPVIPNAPYPVEEASPAEVPDFAAPIQPAPGGGEIAAVPPAPSEEEILPDIAQQIGENQVWLEEQGMSGQEAAEQAETAGEELGEEILPEGEPAQWDETDIEEDFFSQTGEEEAGAPGAGPAADFAAGQFEGSQFEGQFNQLEEMAENFDPNAPQAGFNQVMQGQVAAAQAAETGLEGAIAAEAGLEGTITGEAAGEAAGEAEAAPAPEKRSFFKKLFGKQ